MRKTIYLSLLVLFSLSLQAQYAFIDQGVLEVLDNASEDELIPIIISFEDRVDITALKAELNANNTHVDKRAQIVMQRLKSKSNETQPEIVGLIQDSELAFGNLQRFWIANIIALDACPALIELLANQPALSQIAYNPEAFGLIQPTRESGGSAKSEGGIEPGLEAIGAPFMWEMGYTGHGTIAFPFDTGIMPNHPSHSQRFLGNLMPLAQTWYGYESAVPTDRPGNHGTHVTGTILGLDPATADTIGVAPGAYFISSDVVHNNNDLVRPLADFMLGFEWALNPDGDEETSDDIPDVINNSWGSQDLNDLFDGWSYCDDFVASTLDAVLAAGLANVFSAGNLGPTDGSISVPHNINTGLVNSFAVAAVNGTGSHTVADFSSRGPSACGGEGSLLIKPEVSAPGVNVRSSVGEDEYDNYSGTSMAAPHTSGAILLLKEAFPEATGEEIELALYYTASDLGVPGEDNTYGMGMISLPAAFEYLSETYEPTPPAVATNDLELTSIDIPNLELACETEITPVITVTNLGTIESVGFTAHYDINGEGEMTFESNLIIAPGASEQVTLPAISYTGSGLKELHIWLEELEDEYDVFNNHRTMHWQQLNTYETSGFLYFEEFFESGIDPEFWTISNPDGNITWDTIQAIGPSNAMETSIWMNHPEYTAIESQKDYITTPVFDISGTFYLQFAHYYRKRGSNSFTQDTLRVYLSDNCGELQEIWAAGGADLWTNDDNEQNAFPESSDEWQFNFLDFEVDGGEFYLTFESTNRRGNNLLINEILISSPFSTREVKTLPFELFPNPTNDAVTIIPPANTKVNWIEVRDLSGRCIEKRRVTANQLELDVQDYAKGIYLISLTYERGEMRTEKLIVE